MSLEETFTHIEVVQEKLAPSNVDELMSLMLLLQMF
jgi:hypothetical protein